jgi:hypothetical protein
MQLENAADAVPSDIQSDIETEVEATDTDTEDTEEGAATEEVAPKPDTEKEKMAKSLARKDKRIVQKDAALHEERRRAAALEKELNDLKGKPKEEPQPKPKSKGPKPEDYETVEDYFTDLIQNMTGPQIEKLLEGKFKEFETKTKGEREAFQAEASKAARQARYAEKEVEVAKALPDYREMMEEGFSITPHVIDAIHEADNPPLVAYYVAKEDLFDKLNAMSPTKAAMEIAKLETKAQSLLETQKPTPKPVLTKTPAPLKTNAGTSPGGAKTPDDMEPKELLAWLKPRR